MAFTDAGGRQRSGTARVVGTDPATLALRSAPDAHARRLPPGSEVTLAFRDGRRTLCALGRVLTVTAHEGATDLVWAPTTRRRAYRVAVRLPVDTSLGPGELRDLSAGGGLLALPGPHAPTPGTRLQIRMHLPIAAPPIRLLGRVQRIVTSDPDLVLLGIAFEDMLSKHQDAIARYVAGRQRDLLRQRRDAGA